MFITVNKHFKCLILQKATSFSIKHFIKGGLQKNKSVNLGTLALKGGRGQKNKQFFSLIRKRENYLRGGGVKSNKNY